MKIKDMFDVRKSLTTSREFFDNNGILCVHYGDIYKYYSKKTINSNKIINHFTLQVNDEKLIDNDSIMLPDVTETISDYGHSTYIKYINNYKYINGTHTFAIVNSANFNLKYLFYYLQSSKNIKRLQMMLLGSTAFQLSLNDLKNFELINYHSIKEQQHIVDIRRCCHES